MSEHTAPEAPDDESSPDPRKKYATTIFRVIVATQLVLALLTVGGVWAAYAHLNGNIADGKENVHAEGVTKLNDGPKGPLNILVLGSDSRAGAGNDIDGLGDIGQRADTTILVHLSADRKDAYGVSLPRDAIVDRPDCKVEGGKVVPGADDVMFNTAFAVGGAQCAVQTVESLTKVFVDHFLVLDFNGFKDMVDAVDGVEVCIPKDVDDNEHNIHFTAGTQKLEGQQALNYVRERYVLSVTGDIGRMKRQQAFIGSMVNKVKSAGTLSQPNRVYGFISALTSSIQVDNGLDSIGKLVDLSAAFRDTGLDRIKFITVPIAPYEPDPNRLVWTDEAQPLWDRIIHDKPLGKMLSEGSLSADDPVGTSSASPGDSPSDSPSDNGSDSPSGTPSKDPGLSEAQEQARLNAGLCA